MFTTSQLMTLAALNCLQLMALSSWSWIVLCFLARHDRTLLASQCEYALYPISMLRVGTLLVIAATALSGCSIDAESLKDCKDKDGKPLPEWVCRKDSKEASD